MLQHFAQYWQGTVLNDSFAPAMWQYMPPPVTLNTSESDPVCLLKQFCTALTNGSLNISTLAAFSLAALVAVFSTLNAIWSVFRRTTDKRCIRCGGYDDRTTRLLLPNQLRKRMMVLPLPHLLGRKQSRHYLPLRQAPDFPIKPVVSPDAARRTMAVSPNFGAIVSVSKVYKSPLVASQDWSTPKEVSATTSR